MTVDVKDGLDNYNDACTSVLPPATSQVEATAQQQSGARYTPITVDG